MNDLPRTQALRCFITIAREGSVSRAAALLTLTQPAVSLQLKGLEESIGLLLFNRTPGGFTLTEAGAALLPLAHKAISASSDFRTTAASLREQLRGTLRVGTILEPEFIRLGPFVRGLAISLQKTEVFLRYGMSDDVLAQIGKGELDVGYYIDAVPSGLSESPPKSDHKSDRIAERTIGDGKFQLAPLMRYEYRVIAPMAWSDQVLGKDWADLADLPWLATPLHSAHRRLTDDIFRPLGSLPKRVAFADQEEAVIDFVESGICLGLARDGILDRVTRKRDFVIADKVTLTCDLSFACLASRRHDDMIAHAFSAMQAVWDSTPSSTPPLPIEAARSRKGAAR
jgi:DNA-binding transcriptional LysR family regulator